ncbi:DUF3872 domain-containing protein [Flavobacterium cupreum]|uniref:DUF3872 domain-containing protein n=2 Tax=Flavobacterium TaxID=237 RepID=A0A4Y7UES5_9FLAO|nr:MULTISPECIES: DUF3872 domain-containing protein [Flavobacterium]RUT71564.1 DUF3872 domain-containing protein [Flavobacterium cupreum]TCN59595.1 uncharacterized protein DUF3872 [Flavobacterium circumlabens]TEB44876.1 DUF3872 domain-containing protein [Flavobacterium circumlabens]
MKTFFNKFTIGLLPLILAVLISSVTLLSCDKGELEIQNDFPFEVKVMPISKDIANGDTVEIRLTIQPAGNYTGTQYFIRYFQFDGQGTLRYYNEPPYQPNDLYGIPTAQFRLYYTSNSTVSQSFEVWISDNFGNEKQVSFELNSINR